MTRAARTLACVLAIAGVRGGAAAAARRAPRARPPARRRRAATYELRDARPPPPPGRTRTAATTDARGPRPRRPTASTTTSNSTATHDEHHHDDARRRDDARPRRTTTTRTETAPAFVGGSGSAVQGARRRDRRCLPRHGYAAVQRRDLRPARHAARPDRPRRSGGRGARVLLQRDVIPRHRRSAAERAHRRRWRTATARSRSPTTIYRGGSVARRAASAGCASPSTWGSSSALDPLPSVAARR